MVVVVAVVRPRGGSGGGGGGVSFFSGLTALIVTVDHNAVIAGSP